MGVRWGPLLGWLTKVCIMKISGGQMLRKAGHFFTAFVLGEVFVSGIFVVVTAISGGNVPRF